jgi:Family of unknown function (DUF6492)
VAPLCGANLAFLFNSTVSFIEHGRQQGLENKPGGPEMVSEIGVQRQGGSRRASERPLELRNQERGSGPLAKRFAVVTPTYAPDFEICMDLHRSVLEHTPDSTVHYLITSRADRELFSQLNGPRCTVLTYGELFPRWIKEAAWLNGIARLLRGRSSARIVAVNLHQPFPPIRGWVIQQVAKVALASVVDCDLLVLADSDVQIVRPCTADTFLRDGRVPLYRRMGEVDERLPRHVIWNKVARELLGLPGADPPFPDYVSAFGVWDRASVLAVQQRIQEVTGRHWFDAVTAQLHFSEWTLYGVFLDEVVGVNDVCTTDSSRCHSYWDTTPLDFSEARAFVAALAPDDVAVMINAKSYTPVDVRRAALASLAAEILRPQPSTL